MATILERIVADKRDEVAARKRVTPRAELERRCQGLPVARDFEAALRPAGAPVALIAEVKKASPSRGVLAADLDPVALAESYGRHGVHAISVLTDGPGFGGSLADLAAVRAAVDVPLLRKDFVLDAYQLLEARAHGATIIEINREPTPLTDLADLSLMGKSGEILPSLVDEALRER